jgi:hypothetical protein
LTLPNRNPIPFSTARASAPTAVLSSLIPAHPIPALTLAKKLHPTGYQSLRMLQPTILTPADHLPRRRTNAETRKQNA